MFSILYQVCLYIVKWKYAHRHKPVIVIANLKHLGLDITYGNLKPLLFSFCSFGLVMSLLLMNEEGPKYLSQVYILY